MATKNYTGKDIQVLTDFEHVRQRTNVYLGNTNPTEYMIPILTSSPIQLEYVSFIPAVYKAVGEIIDNSIDEFAQISTRNKHLTIEANPETGKYTITDNGRGVPIDKHETGKYTPEVVFGSLRSGRNFTDDKDVGVIGANGVGSACVNACSTEFQITINRDGKKYQQKFVDGGTKISTPKITKVAGTKTGTSVSFQLDPEVFGDVSLPPQLVRNRAIEIAMTNPDVTVEYNGEKFKMKKGIEEVVSNISNGDYHVFTLDEEHAYGQFYIVFDALESIDETMFTWVNSSQLFDGGKCNTQFFNVLFDSTISHLEKEAKKHKAVITRNDVRQNLLVFANIQLKNPEYDSQAKTRLTGPDLRKEFGTMIQSQWKTFTKKHSEWFADVLGRATERHHRQENKKAIEDHQKTMRKRVVGLLDATSKNRSECQILITEGLSAKSQISEARNPKTTAAFALTGKINNVYGNTPAQVLKMGKLTDLLSAVGLTPGKKAIRSELNYGKIVIATDADHDGSDIFTLLINVFYQFWPELFDRNYEPIVYRLVAPNVCLVNKNKRIHFTTRSEYEKAKTKYKGYEVKYFKGLGSMSRQDWDMVLTGETDTLIPIVDDGHMKETLTLLFGTDVEARKMWLTTSDNEQ